MAKATSTHRIQPIYRWRRRNQTVSNSNSRSPKSQITSQNFGQQKRHDINRCFSSISIIWLQNSKGCQISILRSQINRHDNCQPAVKFSINPKDLH